MAAAAITIASTAAESFLATTGEKLQLNQYWYSADTIRTFVGEIEEYCVEDDGGCAFLSTPSVFFSLTNRAVIERSVLFDCDAESFASRAGSSFALYNFRQPTHLHQRYRHRFSMILVDPPFITEDVWRLYAEACHFLLKPNTGRLILSTIAENHDFLKEILNVHCVRYRPSIPNLIYQYSLYINYSTSKRFDQLNTAIDTDDAHFINSPEEPDSGRFTNSRKKNGMKMESLSSDNIASMRNGSA